MSDSPRSPVRRAAAAADTCVRRACDVSLALSCVGVFVMAIYGSVDVLATFLVGRPVPLARELSEVLLAVAIFSAMAAALREDRHVAVDILVGHAGVRVQRLARGLALLVGGGVFALLVWRSIVAAASSYADGEVAMALVRFPIWPAKILIAVAIVVTLAEYIRLFIRLLLGDPVPRSRVPDA